MSIEFDDTQYAQGDLVVDNTGELLVNTSSGTSPQWITTDSGAVGRDFSNVIYIGGESLDEQDVIDLKMIIKILKANPGIASMLKV